MLIVSAEHALRLLESQKAAFAAEYMEAAKAEFPEFCAQRTDQQITNMLKAECERVKKYSVGTADGIYTIFCLRIRLDRNFPEGKDFAWARAILARDLIPEDERIAALEAVVWGSEDG